MQGPRLRLRGLRWILFALGVGMLLYLFVPINTRQGTMEPQNTDNLLLIDGFQEREEPLVETKIRDDVHVEPLLAVEAPLVISTAQPSSAPTVAPTSPKKLRVICTLMKDEAPFIREWVDFHLAAGWNRFVFYDHNSTDDTEVVVKQLPQQIVEYVKLEPDVAVANDVHRTAPLQGDVYSRCIRKYWHIAEAVTTIDVDEFAFPAEQSWDQSDPFAHAGHASGGITTDGIARAGKMECFKFGIQGLIETPTEDVVDKYIGRLPYTDPERSSVEEYAQKAESFCRSFKWGCQTYGGQKFIYFPNGQHEPISPGIHGFEGRAQRIDITPDRLRGFVCNHIHWRSLKHVEVKARKNLNPHYMDMLGLPIDHPYFEFYSSFKDPAAKNFRAHMREKNQNKSFLDSM